MEWKYIDKILKSFTPEPQGKFPSNMALSILKWMRFKVFFQMKGPALYQGEIITK